MDRRRIPTTLQSRGRKLTNGCGLGGNGLATTQRLGALSRDYMLAHLLVE